MFGLNQNVGNFHSLEVVCRGSERHIQVSKNLNYLIERFKGKKYMHDYHYMKNISKIKEPVRLCKVLLRVICSLGNLFTQQPPTLINFKICEGLSPFLIFKPLFFLPSSATERLQ